MDRPSFLFIINPNSGTTTGKKSDEIARKIKSTAAEFDVEAEIIFTQAQGHAKEIVKNYKDLKSWKAIVAIGGDGTVNEIASGLVNTNTAVGILPMGSGNGLARHLGIPMDIEKALEKLFNGTETTIDSALINDIPFFCTAGVGFDAHVGKLFSEQKTRGLFTYMKVTFQSFWNYQPQNFLLNQIQKNAFSITIANAGQYGNNAWIAPQASVTDGQLNICTIHKFPSWYGVPMVYQLFSKTMRNSRYIEYQFASNALLETQVPPIIHYDGEPLQLSTNRLEIKIKPNSLKIIL